MTTIPLTQKLLFVLGKGGTGRTTVSTSLGLSFAKKKQKTLIVQWSYQDHISPLFGKTPSFHEEVEVAPYLFTINVSTDESIREYFVDHLKMAVFYNFVIQNNHVKKFLKAAPGVKELFFLGRLYWLCELAQEEKGWSYDHIIVDEPAMGHGSSLFTIAETVSRFGVTGPLAKECGRVSSLLSNSQKTGVILTCIPEELPVEETEEFFPVIVEKLKREPLCVIMNRSLKGFFHQTDISVKEDQRGKIFALSTLKSREQFENRFADFIAKKTNSTLFNLSDILLLEPKSDIKSIIEMLAAEISHLHST